MGTGGYIQVGLMKNTIRHVKYIHKLSAETFLLNPENKKYVDHIDNNRQNNKLVNLNKLTSAN